MKPNHINNLPNLGPYVVVQFDCDESYDVVHSTWINDQQTDVMYPQNLKGKTMLDMVSEGISKTDSTYKFKSYEIRKICADGCK